MYSYPLEIIRPSDGSVIGNPTPKNDSDASNVIANAKFIVLNTIIGGKQLGNKCPNIILCWGKQRHFAELK